jgi:hypothetical protein
VSRYPNPARARCNLRKNTVDCWRLIECGALRSRAAAYFFGNSTDTDACVRSVAYAPAV